MSEQTIHTLSLFQINHLRELFKEAYSPANVKVLNCGICNGDMIVGYIIYGEYKVERIPRYPEEPIV